MKLYVNLCFDVYWSLYYFLLQKPVVPPLFHLCARSVSRRCKLRMPHCQWWLLSLANCAMVLLVSRSQQRYLLLTNFSSHDRHIHNICKFFLGGNISQSHVPLLVNFNALKKIHIGFWNLFSACTFIFSIWKINWHKQNLYLVYSITGRIMSPIILYVNYFHVSI